MPIECPHCRQPLSGSASTHGLPFHRCTSCHRFFPNPNRVPAPKTVAIHPPKRRNQDASSALQTALERVRLANGESPQDTDSERARTPETKTEIDLNEKPMADSVPDEPPVRLPVSQLPEIKGYAVEQVLGRGGMGTVYLARQLSLDRPVALKVMSRRWVGDPVFVARFTREAYAAAQMNHPNLVQVYDIGEVEDTRFFSMEYVHGRSLADLIKDEGKIDAETAVGYILQAARGLQHAHERGMIHRDIKPDNILVDGNGLVKVADLGLVKTPDMPAREDRGADTWSRPVSDKPDLTGGRKSTSDMTGVRMALGTPAYMSPEQCRDAASVDHRADIYSLGCTLYVMLTGKPPFDGNTAVELMKKHAYQPLVPPEEIAARVPKGLSAVIQKMMAKHASDRYQSMNEVIRVLEQWLGVHHTARLNAKEEHIAAMEGWTERFYLAPSVLLRQRLVTGFLSGSMLCAVVLTFLGQLTWAFGVAGMVMQAYLVYFIVNGLSRKTHFFGKVRQFAVGLSVGDWLICFAITGMFAVLLWMLQLFWIWVGFGLIGTGVALALRVGIDRAVDIERDRALQGCKRLIRQLRKQGLDEEQVRQFVARYSGRYWEEFFEAIFGYEAKLQARLILLRGESAGPREMHAAWREPLIEWIDRVAKNRQAVNEHQLLTRTEKARLIATGIPEKAARKQAVKTADVVLRQADELRLAEEKRRAQSPPLSLSRPVPGNPVSVPDFRRLLTTGEPTSVRARRRLLHWENLGALIPPLLGTIGVVLISACIAWAVQNQIWVFGQLRHSPLAIPGVPASWTAWIDSMNVGWAGLLLLISLFYRGSRMTMLTLVAAVVTLFAHRVVNTPAVEPLKDHHIAAMLGTVLALIGYRFGTR